MSNTSLFMEGEYNLTSIISNNVINEPERWVYNWNTQMEGWAIFGLLVVIMIVLYLIMRRNDNIKDTEAVSYAGFVCSIGALLLVLISVDGQHLISWGQTFIIWVITGIAVLLDKINGRY